MRVRKTGLWPVVLGFGVLALIASGCGDGITVPDGIDGDCTGADAIVTVASGHVHDVDIPDMDAVRARDMIYISTVDEGHTHEVGVSAMDFASINRGNVVYKLTSKANGHSHQIALGCTY